TRPRATDIPDGRPATLGGPRRWRSRTRAVSPRAARPATGSEPSSTWPSSTPCHSEHPIRASCPSEAVTADLLSESYDRSVLRARAESALDDVWRTPSGAWEVPPHLHALPPPRGGDLFDLSNSKGRGTIIGSAQHQRPRHGNEPKGIAGNFEPEASDLELFRGAFKSESSRDLVSSFQSRRTRQRRRSDRRGARHQQLREHHGLRRTRARQR